MGKRAQSSDSEPRELIPAKTYLGVLRGAYDIGTQPGHQGGKAEPKFVLAIWRELVRLAAEVGPPATTTGDGGEASRDGQPG